MYLFKYILGWLTSLQGGCGAKEGKKKQLKLYKKHWKPIIAQCQ